MLVCPVVVYSNRHYINDSGTYWPPNSPNLMGEELGSADPVSSISSWSTNPFASPLVCELVMNLLACTRDPLDSLASAKASTIPISRVGSLLAFSLPTISRQYFSTVRPYSPGAALESSVMIWFPITTPSAMFATLRKCSRVLIPNPTAAGIPPEQV